MIDCHLHLQDPLLAPKVDEIFAVTRPLGITRMVVSGTRPGDWDAVEALASAHSEILPQFGLHPWRIDQAEADWLGSLENRLRSWPEAGVGEIGLDRWIKGSDFARQKEVFSAQLELARRLRRPATVHCLRAWGGLLEAIDRTPTQTGLLLHSYGGPAELVPAFVGRGCYFSLSGYFFREGKEAKLAVFDSVPTDRILLETDAPDMGPPPEMRRYRIRAGRRSFAEIPGDEPNHPANLAAVYEAFATRKGIGLGEAVALTERNFTSWQSLGRGR